MRLQDKFNGKTHKLFFAAEEMRSKEIRPGPVVLYSAPIAGPVCLEFSPISR